MNDDKLKVLPMLALRGMVVFPHTMLHFEVGRKKSIAALRAAMTSNQKIFVVSQRDVIEEEPQLDDLYSVGVISSVKQILNVNGDTIRVIIEGHERAALRRVVSDRRYRTVLVEQFFENKITDEIYEKALVRKIRESFEDYASLNKRLPSDMVLSVLINPHCGELADYIASNLMLSVEDKQSILNKVNIEERVEELCVILERETTILETEKEIIERVQERIDTNQREYYLREQLKVIADELGDGDNPADEANEYINRIASLKLSEEIEEKLMKEAGRLMKMPPASHEATVIQSYLDTCLALPWNESSKENLDLIHARKVLDRDHYGMDKIKDRIIEFLAVRKLAPDINGQIICLVGPPGVGKTSIARSVAKAIGRNYQRISLGGVSDESEIRGHRRTYVGAMYGRIISAVNQAKTNNPLILLDEIDKLTSNMRGDPTSAMLEVLDPEQNSTFTDHYIDLPFDLSKVMFITTANTVETIPAPLRDRMEIITLTSYTREEKFNIAKKHLVSKQIKRHGLNGNQIRFNNNAIYEIIDSYTREAGVRNLEREIASICRKSAKMVANGEIKRLNVTPEVIEDMLGPKKFKKNSIECEKRIGVVTGLAWTSVGGDTMPIEALVLDGTGKLELTGSLGDVMKESARAAVSYIRSRADEFDIDKDFYKNKDIHIHVPEGAIPKDGPSAGVTITTALVSALSKRPVSTEIAMTGEITLTGRVLPIGGLKEKTMAAYMLGIKKVIIPYENEPDLEEIDKTVRSSIEFISVRKLDDVLDTALQ